jgi:hypothetical protein
LLVLLVAVGQRSSENNQWATGTAGWSQKSSEGEVDWTQSPPASSAPPTTASSQSHFFFFFFLENVKNFQLIIVTLFAFYLLAVSLFCIFNGAQ